MFAQTATCIYHDYKYLRFMEPAVIILLGGVLPFGSIFIEM